MNVVLDLSDTPSPMDAAERSEAKRLVDMLRETADEFFVADAARLARKVADQIEQQTRPPKPEEPQGLGAVVEATCACRPHAQRFIYEPLTSEFEGRPRKQVPWKAGCGHHTWSQLDAVRVLSEGIS